MNKRPIDAISLKMLDILNEDEDKAVYQVAEELGMSLYNLNKKVANLYKRSGTKNKYRLIDWYRETYKHEIKKKSVGMAESIFDYQLDPFSVDVIEPDGIVRVMFPKEQQKDIILELLQKVGGVLL